MDFINKIPNVIFETESPIPELARAKETYEKIWFKERFRICKKLNELTGLQFAEKEIDVIVYEGISYSGSIKKPMRLRASYQDNVKLATLIHELGHRLLSGNGINSIEEDQVKNNYENHANLNLFLYDTWSELYGEDFALEQSNVEANRVDFYRQAWKWALSMSKTERQKKLKTLLQAKD